MCFQVGNGRSIDIWSDPWVPWLSSFKPSPIEGGEKLPMLVDDFILPNSRTWDEPMLMNIFDNKSVTQILRIPIPSVPRLDKLI